MCTTEHEPATRLRRDIERGEVIDRRHTGVDRHTQPDSFDQSEPRPLSAGHYEDGERRYGDADERGARPHHPRPRQPL